MTDELRQMYVDEIARLREENRRLIASEAEIRAKAQISGRIIGQLARKAHADLQRIAATRR
jgi:hypothetical protein